MRFKKQSLNFVSRIFFRKKIVVKNGTRKNGFAKFISVVVITFAIQKK